MCWIILLGIQLAAANNLALHKPTTQQSTEYGGVASRAVDGNTNPQYHEGNSCSYSRGWWGVDLQDVYNISHVVITRRDAGGLSDFHIVAYRTSPLICPEAVQAICAYHGPEVPPVLNQTCQADTVGRYLRIEKPTSTSVFILCELEVFGTKVADNNECTGPRKFVKQEGVKVEGEGLIQGNATTRGGCSLECVASPQCDAFSFNPSLAECVLSGGFVSKATSVGWQTYGEC